MGIGDWGLGIGDWGLGPIPNPQSPFKLINIFFIIYSFFYYYFLFKVYKKNEYIIKQM